MSWGNTGGSSGGSTGWGRSGGGGGGGGDWSSGGGQGFGGLWPDVFSSALGAVTPDVIEKPIHTVGAKFLGGTIPNLVTAPFKMAPGFAVGVGGLIHDIGHDYQLANIGKVIYHGDAPRFIWSEAMGRGDPKVSYLPEHTDHWLARDLTQMAESMVHGYEAKYNPQHGGITGVLNRALVDDPFGTLLDLTVVGRGVDKLAALPAARAGKLGATAKTLAHQDERLLTADPSPGSALEGGVVTERFRAAETLWGRYRQMQYDRLSTAFPDLAVIGSRARVTKVATRRMEMAEGQARRFLPQLRYLEQKVLTPVENAVMDIILQGRRDSSREGLFDPTAEAHPLVQEIRYREAKLVAARGRGEAGRLEAANQQRLLDALRLPGAREVIDNPRPELRRYVNLLRKMDHIASKAAEAAGVVWDREARRLLVQRVQSGAKYGDNLQTLRANRRAADQRIKQLGRERVKRVERKGRWSGKLADRTRERERLEQREKDLLAMGRVRTAPDLVAVRHELGLSKAREETARRKVESITTEEEQHARDVKLAHEERASARAAKREDAFHGGLSVQRLQELESGALASHFGLPEGLPRIDIPETTNWRAFERAKKRSKRAAYLSPKTKLDYQNSRVFLSHDRKVGYMISEEGDLQNVFNNGGPRGAGQTAVIQAIRNGARTLDAFDPHLPPLYSQYGFVETSRMKFVEEYAPDGWDFAADNHPDVVHMAYKGGDPATIHERVGHFPDTFTHASTRKYTEDFDAAKQEALQASDPVGGGPGTDAALGADGTGLRGGDVRAGADVGQGVRPGDTGGAGPAASVVQPGPLAQFGPALRSPHLTSVDEPGFFSGFATLMNEPRTPSMFKRNRAVLYEGARLTQHPERFSVDFMHQMKYNRMVDFFHNVIYPYSREIDPRLVETGGHDFPDGAFYIRPLKRTVDEQTGQVHIGRTLPVIPREVKQSVQIAEDWNRNIVENEKAFSEWTAEMVKDDVPEEYASLPESAALRQMAEDGVRVVPMKVGKAWEREGKVTNRWVRQYWDRGLMAGWRYLTLNSVSRWLVNNAITATCLYALKYAGEDGIRSYVDAVRRMPDGEATVGRMRAMLERNVTRRGKPERATRPVKRRVAEEDLRDVGLAYLKEASFSKQERIKPHAGIIMSDEIKDYRRLIKPLMSDSRKARTVRFPLRQARRVANAWTNGITRMNTAVENLNRDAATIAEMRQFSRKAGKANQSYEDVLNSIEELGRVDPRMVENLGQDVLDMMGDFHNLGSFERSFVRRYVFPFYSWYKTITQVVGKYVWNQPARTWLLYNLSQAVLGSKYMTLQFPRPEYLMSLVPGDPGSHNESEQTAYSFVGANPFQTPLDLYTQVTALGQTGTTEQSLAGPASLLGPVPQSLITLLTGQDTFYGGQYAGPGSSMGRIGMAVGSMLDVPQQRLIQQLTGTYKSNLYVTEGPSPVPGVSQGAFDGLMQYLGIPIRHINPEEARSRAAEASPYSGGSGGEYTGTGTGGTGSGWGR